MVSSDKLKLLPWHAISFKSRHFFILRNTINSYATSAPKAKFVWVLEKLAMSKGEHKRYNQTETYVVPKANYGK